MLEIKELSFGYKNSSQLFNNLNLELNVGNIYGLLGKNGAGKTTLLRLISGLLFSAKGSCNVLGYNPKERCPDFLAEIYFIPEEFYVPAISAEQYVKLYAPFYHNFDQQVFHEMFREFGLSPDRKLAALSYGQKKKFLVAFGLATNCKLLILDEPTNGLDIPSKSQFRKLLASQLSEERTFIISTHQVRDMENLIDTVVILEEGQIIFQQDLFTVAKKIIFEQRQDLGKDGDIIYTEKGFSGYNVLAKNKFGYESKLDLELLFNAIVAEHDKINQLFAEGH